MIRLTVRLYFRYPLSLRRVEDLLFERGIDICHHAVLVAPLRTHVRCGDQTQTCAESACCPQCRWHLGEVFVKINGEMHDLWRAVDHQGEDLEVFATIRRGRSAALAAWCALAA